MRKSLSNWLNEQLLEEGFIITGNVVKFIPNDDTGMTSKFGKGKAMKPFEGKLPFGRFYAAYQKSANVDQSQWKELLKAIKGQSSQLTIDYDSYQKFINRTAIFLSKRVIESGADTILLMQSSSSLVTDIVHEMNRRLPKYYEIRTYNSALFKSPETIRFDSLGKDLQDSTKNSLIKIVDVAKTTGKFTIKDVNPKDRKFLKDWLKINDSFLSKIVDKHVCLIDDFVTSGETMKTASEQLRDAGALSVTGLAIMKG
jgi:hypothetical protein